MFRFVSGLFKLILFALILVFAIYNFDVVTLRFANVYEFTLPLAVVIFLVFVHSVNVNVTK